MFQIKLNERHAAEVYCDGGLVLLRTCVALRPARPGLVPLQEVMQCLARLGLETVLAHTEAVDAVETEGAEVVAQLAPRGKHPYWAEVGEAQWPDCAFGGFGQRVTVLEVHLELVAQRVPELR